MSLNNMRRVNMHLIFRRSKHQIQLSQTEGKVIFGLGQQPCAVFSSGEGNIVGEQELGCESSELHASNCKIVLALHISRGLHIHLRFLPIQLKGPMENGANASGCLIISGLEYHRSGMKEVASV